MLNPTKDDTSELIYKTQIDSHTWKTNLWLPKGKEREGQIGSLELTFTCIQLFAILWTVTHRLLSPLSTGFSKQKYQNGLLCPPPVELPNTGIKTAPLMSPALAAGFFTTSTTWEAQHIHATEYKTDEQKYLLSSMGNYIQYQDTKSEIDYI